MAGFEHWIDRRGIMSKQEYFDKDTKESGIQGVVAWGKAYKRKSIGTCTGHKDCFEKVEFRCCYKYITGKAGRVSWQERFFCKAHADKFAKNHRVSDGWQNLPVD